jgi:hypothetical protein
MSGRQRLPGGEPRRASQRSTRRAASTAARIAFPIWRPGDNVRWKGRAGLFRRDMSDGEHCEITLGERVYRVRITEIE